MQSAYSFGDPRRVQNASSFCLTMPSRPRVTAHPQKVRLILDRTPQKKNRDGELPSRFRVDPEAICSVEGDDFVQDSIWSHRCRELQRVGLLLLDALRMPAGGSVRNPGQSRSAD